MNERTRRLLVTEPHRTVYDWMDIDRDYDGLQVYAGTPVVKAIGANVQERSRAPDQAYQGRTREAG